MAVLKLKLKVGGNGSPGESDAGNSSSATPAASKQPKVPKIKLNPPKTKKKVSTKIEKPDKIKKLKISLGGNKKTALNNMNVEGITQQVKKLPKVRVKPTRVPGDGYDSETPDMEDDPLIENGIVIRFLDDINLDIVHNAVESNDLSGINVKWLTKEKALVNLRGNIYSARLVDLPTVNEVFKTIDKKNIFKVLDLCQMLLVLKPVVPSELNLETDFEVPSDKAYRHPLYDLKPRELKETRPVLKDGLIAPFQNVYRRFRPKKLNHRVMDDIEQKVNELIQLDNNAEESHFEILDATKANMMGPARFSPSPPPMMQGQTSQASLQQQQQQQQAQQQQQIIPQDDMEASGDEDEDLEEELAKALETNVGILNGEENGEVIIEGETPGMEEEDEDDEEDEEDEDDDEDDDDDDDDDDEDDEAGQQSGGRHHAKMLEEEILDLEKAVAVHKKGLDTATHKMMKMKFQSSYNTLKASLDSKKRELSKLLGEDEDAKANSEAENEAAEDAEDKEEDDDEDLDDLDDLF